MADAPPVLFCLPGLGIAARSFDPLVAALGDRVGVRPLDLPGFGDAAATGALDVEDTVEYVRRAVASSGATRWLLLGHSMGGKIATILASRALAGAPGLFGLAGVVLLAGSPPSPEPMADEQRAELLSWVADGPVDETHARQYVADNVGEPLPAELEQQLVADVGRSDPTAWRAWLTRGSREDWTAAVGTLDLPALLVGGTADADLGAAAQPGLFGAVYPRARYVVLDGAGHLLAQERPAEVAAAVIDFWRSAGTAPVVPPDVARVIASDRVSARTRSLLAKRALADDPSYAPRVLSAAQLATLRLVADRVVPQDGPAIDLAARLDAKLARGEGDGWRFDDMPADAAAYRSALDGLAELATLSPAARDERLAALAAGDGQDGVLTPTQLRHWFEDTRDDLIRLWLAHPASLARIGFDGFANGGDGVRKQGFTLLAAGTREAWEPAVTA